MAVMIGVDPHKGSHTAVAIDRDEIELATVTGARDASSGRRVVGVGGTVRGADVGGRVRGWARLSRWRSSSSRRVSRWWTCRRRWRRGCGCSASGRSNKNDPNDALFDRGRGVARTDAAPVGRRITRACCGCWRSATAIWAGPGTAPRVGCMRCWSSSSRAESPRKSTLQRAAAARSTARPRRRRSSEPATTSPSSISRTCVASTTRCAPRSSASPAAVAASGTTLTEIFGVGPVVAAMVIGHTGDVARFANRDHFAAYNGTAPIEVSLRRPDRASAVATREPPAEPCDPHRRDHPDPSSRTHPAAPSTTARLAEGKTKQGSAPRAEASHQRRRSTANCVADAARARAREGKRGRLCNPA